MQSTQQQVKQHINYFHNDKTNHTLLSAGKDSKLYECPIYRKPARTELNYIGSIDFESDIGPRHWVMRGVALLCDIK